MHVVAPYAFLAAMNDVLRGIIGHGGKAGVVGRRHATVLDYHGQAIDAVYGPVTAEAV